MTTFPGGLYGLNQIANPEVNSLGAAFQNDAVAKNPIGGMIRRDNALLRYVKFSAGTVVTVPVPGAPAYAKVFTPTGTATAVPVFTVTAYHTDSVMGLQPVGVFLGFTTAPTDGNYIWIAVAGKINTQSPGNIAGSVLIGSATDNQFAIIADGSTLTNIPVGRVCGTSAAGLAPAMLMNMDW